MKKITLFLLSLFIVFAVQEAKATIVTVQVEDIYHFVSYNGSGEITSMVYRVYLNSGNITFTSTGIFYSPASYTYFPLTAYETYKPMLELLEIAMKDNKSVQVYYDSATLRVSGIVLLYN